MIDGLEITWLETTTEKNGRSIQAGELSTGQDIVQVVYHPGTVDAWKRYIEIDIWLSVLSGALDLAVFDGRRESASYGAIVELHAGEHRPVRLSIPAGVFWGVQIKSSSEATILLGLSVSDATTESLPFDTHLIPYVWG